jgi:3D (Asp-Asp-Asp) domain-containing protein
MAFTIDSPRRRAAVALLAGLVVITFAYETRMLDSGYTAWLEMISSEDEAPGPGSHLVFDATAYCKGLTTAAGVNVRRGIAAADPRLLPVGSVVTLATGDPEYNGVYTIMDTGPKVQGRLLDLYLWSCHEALKFGRRRIEVTVLRLGWDPRASSPSLIDRLFRRREIARRAAESKSEKPPEAEDTPPPADPSQDSGDELGADPSAPGAPPPPLDSSVPEVRPATPESPAASPPLVH